MRHKLVTTTRLAVTTAAVTLLLNARAGEIGHYGGGVLNIRDYVMPDPGFYTAIYNYHYTTDQLNNSFLSINVHGFYEYSAEDRFQGGSFGVGVAKKF